ncbi:MAG: hypothetical protein DBX97_01935 [Collinsella tanakaei]|nr:MAG: hypothetical protein DBX97_01935 [Collinsella tanakaei]
MIYVTGDTHGDISRFETGKAKRLKKGDTLIVCGDFGFLWDGSEKEEKLRNRLQKKKYTILFVDGSHENYDMLAKYPVTEWNGGKVQQIGSNLYHLLRAQVFSIEGKKIFTFGGGESEDRQMYADTGLWWPQEMPSLEEMQEGVQNLKKNDMQVDYIITHYPAPRMKTLHDLANLEKNQLDMFFEQIARQVTFQGWFFGSLHLDRKITNTYSCVFREIVPLYQEPSGGKRFRR